MCVLLALDDELCSLLNFLVNAKAGAWPLNSKRKPGKTGRVSLISARGSLTWPELHFFFFAPKLGIVGREVIFCDSKNFRVTLDQII